MTVDHELIARCGDGGWYTFDALRLHVVPFAVRASALLTLVRRPVMLPVTSSCGRSSCERSTRCTTCRWAVRPGAAAGRATAFGRPAVAILRGAANAFGALAHSFTVAECKTGRCGGPCALPHQSR